MKIEEAQIQIDLMRERAQADGDAVLICYFSREQDGYNGFMTNMDGGDALLVIDHLIKQFKLSPAVIASIVLDEQRGH